MPIYIPTHTYTRAHTTHTHTHTHRYITSNFDNENKRYLYHTYLS